MAAARCPKGTRSGFVAHGPMLGETKKHNKSSNVSKTHTRRRTAGQTNGAERDTDRLGIKGAYKERRRTTRQTSK